MAYSLGIYLLNLFLAFISPKFDPSLEQDEGMEDGTSGLPSKENDEFKPFVRRLPEFKFWYSATKAITIGFVCSFFTIFDLPVFWPVLVMYWIILFALTSKFSVCTVMVGEQALMTVCSEATDTAYDQVQICSVHGWQGQVWCEIEGYAPDSLKSWAGELKHACGVTRDASHFWQHAVLKRMYLFFLQRSSIGAWTGLEGMFK